MYKRSERRQRHKVLHFWKDDILMRQTYHTNGKELIIIPKAARMSVLQLAHNSSLVGHCGTARTLEAIRTRMDKPGIRHRREKNMYFMSYM